MVLSYEETVARDYWNSLTPNLSETPFTIKEIIAIRAHLEDLRSAPCLADAPVDFTFLEDENSRKCIEILFDGIKIRCSIVSQRADPRPDKIKRVKILEISHT